MEKEQTSRFLLLHPCENLSSLRSTTIVFSLAPCVTVCVSQSGSVVLTDGEGERERERQTEREGGSKACWVNSPQTDAVPVLSGNASSIQTPLPGLCTCSEAWQWASIHTHRHTHRMTEMGPWKEGKRGERRGGYRGREGGGRQMQRGNTRKGKNWHARKRETEKLQETAEWGDVKAEGTLGERQRWSREKKMSETEVGGEATERKWNEWREREAAKHRDEALDCKWERKSWQRDWDSSSSQQSTWQHTLLVCSDGLSAGLQENCWHYFHETQWDLN